MVFTLAFPMTPCGRVLSARVACACHDLAALIRKAGLRERFYSAVLSASKRWGDARRSRTTRATTMNLSTSMAGACASKAWCPALEPMGRAAPFPAPLLIMEGRTFARSLLSVGATSAARVHVSAAERGSSLASLKAGNSCPSGCVVSTVGSY